MNPIFRLRPRIFLWWSFEYEWDEVTNDISAVWIREWKSAGGAG